MKKPWWAYLNDYMGPFSLPELIILLIPSIWYARNSLLYTVSLISIVIINRLTSLIKQDYVYAYFIYSMSLLLQFSLMIYMFYVMV